MAENFEGGAERAQIERNAMASHTNRVVEKLLNTFELSGKRVLGVSVRPDTELIAFLKEKKANYTASNVPGEWSKEEKDLLRENESFVVAQESKLWPALPFPDEAFDAVYETHALARRKEARGTLISEMVRVATSEILVVEYDWSTFQSPQSRALFESIQWINNFLSSVGNDPTIGGKLETLVPKTDSIKKVEYTLQTFPEGNAHAAGLLAYLRTLRHYTIENTPGRRFVDTGIAELEKGVSFVPAAIGTLLIRK